MNRRFSLGHKSPKSNELFAGCWPVCICWQEDVGFV